MIDKPIEMSKMIEMKGVSNESYNGEELSPYELSLFVEKLSEKERPIRFYDVKLASAEGRLLLTNENVMFIGKSDGERVEVIIEVETVVGVEMGVNDSNKKEGSLTLLVKDGNSITECEFSMSRFGLKALANNIINFANDTQ